MLIGLAGKRGVGKSTAARILVKEFGFIEAAFAEPFKEGLAHIFGWSIGSMYAPEEKEEMTVYGFSRREAMQFIGQSFRERFGNDIWIKVFEEQRKAELNADYNIVLCDIRHENEAEFVRKKDGVIIHIMSYERVKNEDPVIDTHVSELGLSIEPDLDYVIVNDGSIQAFANAIVKLTHHILTHS